MGKHIRNLSVAAIDLAIDLVNSKAFTGYVDKFPIPYSPRSYFFEEEGVLKYYNSTTKETKIVTLEDE